MSFGKVICAISGGVDSAVAALLMKRKGLDVVGVFMRNWDIRDELGSCGNDEDKIYAQKVCKNLEIPFHEVNLVKEYWLDVFEPTLASFMNGQTPNPDVLCNKHVKFDAFHKKCLRIVDSQDVIVATGHYARTTIGEKVFNKQKGLDVRLLKGVDETKDQTFFLHKISNKALQRTYFPLGDLKKSKVKEIAQSSEIKFTLDRKESMGICFIGKRSFKDFLSNYIPPSHGRFVSYDSGEVLGEHNGCFLYTIGQRSGIGGLAKLQVVVHKDVTTGDVIVAEGPNHPLLFSKSFVTGPVHWVSHSPPKFTAGGATDAQFRFQHRHPLVNCRLHKVNDNQTLVLLDHPVRAITPGQDAVFYSGDECLGGAAITDCGPSVHESRYSEFDFAPFRKNRDLWLHLTDVYGREVGAFPDEAMQSRADNFLQRQQVIDVVVR